MQIAILGYGTIGSGVANIIARQTNQTKSLSVTHLLTKPENTSISRLATGDITELLADPDLDAVVETIGGIEPAHTYIMQALAAHKHVVTANKAVVALYLRDFTEAAEQNGVHFYYEATTGGGIPWLKNLENAVRVDDLTTIAGIFNGTSNYILDQMTATGEDFHPALAQAQALGYAEADPSADIDGIDVANKLRISSAIAFNSAPNFVLPTIGIRHITAEDIAWAQDNGLAIRLLGQAVRAHDRFAAVIAPTLVPQASLEAQCPANNNLIRLVGPTIGELQFFGQGAGQLPTAHAIIQDLLDINNHVPHVARHFNRELQNDAELLRGDYIWRDADGAHLVEATTTAEMAIRLRQHPEASALRLGKEVNNESLQIRRVLDGQY